MPSGAHLDGRGDKELDRGKEVVPVLAQRDPHRDFVGLGRRRGREDNHGQLRLTPGEDNSGAGADGDNGISRGSVVVREGSLGRVRLGKAGTELANRKVSSPSTPNQPSESQDLMVSPELKLT